MDIETVIQTGTAERLASDMSTAGSLRSTELVAPPMGQPGGQSQVMNVHPASQTSNRSRQGARRERPVGSVQADLHVHVDVPPYQKSCIQQPIGEPPIEARCFPFAGGQVGSGHAGTVDDTDNNKGNNDQLTSLQHDSGSNRDDISFSGLSAPPEILARGGRARRAYAKAAQAGTKKVFRTRLMLVGQERVGKTSLKKTLTGQGFDKNEAITEGVETTNSCEINIEVAKADGKMWSIHKKEDEYSKAIANDIAKRLIVTPPQVIIISIQLLCF
ncbi:uncharacterized protein LOC105440078 [Strongylocentrotus purpuratus]|uniref:Uncharacterized protein n=1 Tax=Strongylocentrotus purpuratus TaxID=7668 RepID=A0A7M7P3S3_STRPU|nr:uncharacterized protein LOC105440078 [Strongylocentrotus purpuratus]